MDRSLHPVYLQARAALERLLDDARFTLAHESHSPQSFGSAYADYARDHRRIRLLWDGKEQFLLLLGAHVMNAGDARIDWSSLTDEPSASDLQLGGSAEARIHTLGDALRQFLATAA